MWIAISSKQLVALKTMTEVVLWTIGIYSFAGHKEWRFIHPLLPLLHILATKSLDDISMIPSTKKQGKGKTLLNIAIPRRYLVWLMLTCPLSLYVVLFYCSAPISAMSFFRSLPRQTLSSITVGVLMPCHSIPGQAYLHREELTHGRLWALGCEPPLQYVKYRLKLHVGFVDYSNSGQDLVHYRDQTDVFYDSPISYLRTYFPLKVNTSFPLSPYPATAPGTLVEPSSDGRYPWRHEWPTHLLFFGCLLEQEGIRQMFVEQGYIEIWKRGRHWEGDDKRKGGVRVWKWTERK